MTSRLTLTCLAMLLPLSRVFAADKPADNPPVPNPQIKRVPITLYPNNVIVVRGKMVDLDKLKEHLAALVPDAKKPSVEVTVYPNSKAEMNQVSEVIRIAKEAGYTNVSYSSPRETKDLPTQIVVLLSKTGELFVNEMPVKEAELKAHIEKLVDADNRPKVRIYVRFSRLVPMKKVSAIVKVCKDAGYTDVAPGLIEE